MSDKVNDTPESSDPETSQTVLRRSIRDASLIRASSYFTGCTTIGAGLGAILPLSRYLGLILLVLGTAYLLLAVHSVRKVVKTQVAAVSNQAVITGLEVHLVSPAFSLIITELPADDDAPVAMTWRAKDASVSQIADALRDVADVMEREDRGEKAAWN